MAIHGKILAASRIDWIYVPDAWTAKIQWVSVEKPPLKSDHQTVSLHVAQVPASQAKKCANRRVSYPIRTSQPDRVRLELLEELISVGVRKNESARTWDRAAVKCIGSIREVRRRGQRRASKYAAKTRAHLLTRDEVIGANMEKLRAEKAFCMGQNVERTADRVRWQFRRISDWGKDRTVTSIHPINGAAFGRNMSTVDKFASEWKPILDQRHSKIAREDLAEEFDAFVSISKD
ncbi:hypothetical protein GQ600_26482 [Phytophthora cactorum]|nr:hypothetical protein GQ600_26482 [Phytophthora cactorum]